jgi:hypothetical protein
MTVQSEVHPSILLNAGLSEANLCSSALAINGMKLLRYSDTNGGIQLTQGGNFNRKCVEWAANEFRWPGYSSADLYAVNKVLNEPDFPPLFTLHDMLISYRLLRHLKGRAVLTKAGKTLLGRYGELQAKLFDISLLSADPYHYDQRVVEAGLWDVRHIIVVAANRLDKWITIKEFTQWCLPVDAFPTSGSLGQQHEASLYLWLHAIRPLVWLGLLDEVKATVSKRPANADFC